MQDDPIAPAHTFFLSISPFRQKTEEENVFNAIGKIFLLRQLEREHGKKLFLSFDGL